MRIAMVGTGYVGLCTGVGLALRGNAVTCVDTLPEKVASINAGRSPIFEPGLEEALRKALRTKALAATTDLPAALASADLVFIAVGTPSRKDGAIDLSAIHQAAWDIGHALKARASADARALPPSGGQRVGPASRGRVTIVVKSTVVPGTTEHLVKPVLEEASGLRAGVDFGLAMNPEFLREGAALDDFLSPDRIVIGALDPESALAVKKAYAKLRAPILSTTLTTAEMTKYAANTLLAAKISFSNEIGNLCKRLGIDAYEVMAGVGLDKRIGPHFLSAGIGYGGSCFSKDVSALQAQAKQMKLPTPLLDAVQEVNRRQREHFVGYLEHRLGSLKKKRIAVLGLAFKAGTDDIRDAPATDIISALKKRKALVVAYDPKAAENMRKVHADITYAPTVAEALRDADAAAVLTDWPEFRSLTDADFAPMKQRLVIEGRRILDRKKVSSIDGICW